MPQDVLRSQSLRHFIGIHEFCIYQIKSKTIFIIKQQNILSN